MATVVRRGGVWHARIVTAAGRQATRPLRQKTRRDALRVAEAMEALEERRRFGLDAPPATKEPARLCGALLDRWLGSLTNRSRDCDRGRARKHLVPRWRRVPIAEVTLTAIVRWLDELGEAAELSAGSRRHLLGLLSRFMSWATARGYAPRNPCRDLPVGTRPRVVQPPPESIPWLRTDGEVLRIMRALPAPFDAVFFVANRSGARLSEVLSLRLSDLDELDAGVVRLRYAGEDGTGWLKEAHGPRTKYAPLPPDDARAVLAPLLEARRAAGAEPEAFLFVDAAGARIDRHAVTYRWRIARAALELPKALNFYRATRHSAASRALASGASVDEISQSLGHANPAITAKHYLHHVRKTFSPILTAGLGLDAEPAKVISLAARKGADA